MRARRRPSIAIIGAGAFATYALERLAARLRAGPLEVAPIVHVINAGPRFGAGMAQDWAQSSSSAMNRVAAQIGFAADESNGPHTPLLERNERFEFLEWTGRRFAETGDRRYALGPRDAPARAIHGEALRAAYQRYCAILLNAGAEIVEHVAEIANLEESGNGDLVVVDTSGVRRATADVVLLATGHPDNMPTAGSLEARLADHAAADPSLTYLHQVYPLNETAGVDRIQPGALVGVIGMGLAAIDLLLHLTEGRGGRFARNPEGRLAYQRCGLEPASLIPFAPSGLFVAARALNQKVGDPQDPAPVAEEHRGMYLTAAAVEALRASVGRSATLSAGTVAQLDFASHIFPLLLLEMAFIDARTRFGAKDLGAAAASAYHSFLRGPPARPEEGIQMLIEAAGGYDWQGIFAPLAANGSGQGDLRGLMIAHLRRDIEDARAGNVSNPRKAACDGAWRDLRAVLASAVDRGGLTASSQRDFQAVYWRHYSRLSNGPALPAAEKLLALIEAGIVDPGIGVAPLVESAEGSFRIIGGQSGARREVSVLANARVHDFDLGQDRSPLYRNLARRGMIRRWRNPGGEGDQDFLPGCLDLDLALHPIDANGMSDPRITILGAPAERLIYFHLSAARPNSNSTIINQADEWAAGAISLICARAQERALHEVG